VRVLPRECQQYQPLSRQHSQHNLWLSKLMGLLPQELESSESLPPCWLLQETMSDKRLQMDLLVLACYVLSTLYILLPLSAVCSLLCVIWLATIDDLDLSSCLNCSVVLLPSFPSILLCGADEVSFDHVLQAVLCHQFYPANPP
jgi:hypothetical protein